MNKLLAPLRDEVKKNSSRNNAGKVCESFHEKESVFIFGFLSKQNKKTKSENGPKPRMLGVPERAWTQIITPISREIQCFFLEVDRRRLLPSRMDHVESSRNQKKKGNIIQPLFQSNPGCYYSLSLHIMFVRTRKFFRLAGMKGKRSCFGVFG